MITTSYPCQAVCVVRPLDIQQQLDILSITTSLPGMLFDFSNFKRWNSRWPDDNGKQFIISYKLRDFIWHYFFLGLV